MLWQKLPYEALLPRVVVSGFPKAGLHLAVRMVGAMVQPQPGAGMFGDEWVGTFAHHAWTTEWLDSRSVCFRLGRVQPGHYVKGHIGHRAEIESFLYYLGAAHVFVYRELRDVAVSQAHHILARNARQFQHEGKAVFGEMYEQGGFEAVLEGVIRGVGPWAGVVKRWELYEEWTRVDWCLALSFQELREEPEQSATRILGYCMRRTVGSFGLKCVLDEGEMAEKRAEMVTAAEQRLLSPTFREGGVGGWREVWTDELEAAYLETGGEAGE